MTIVAPHGFVLAGGLALVEWAVSTRPTEDLDSFSSTCNDIGVVATELAAAMEKFGYIVQVDRVGPNFARMVIATGRYRRSSLRVELGRDSQIMAAEVSSLGPILALAELAANKVLAAFGRHQPRDLCDLHALARVLPLEQMLADAPRKDAGFDPAVLAEMIERTIAFPDEIWPIGADVAEVRRWSAALAAALADESQAMPVVGDLIKPVAAYRRQDGRIVRGYMRSNG